MTSYVVVFGPVTLMPIMLGRRSSLFGSSKPRCFASKRSADSLSCISTSIVLPCSFGVIFTFLIDRFARVDN